MTADGAATSPGTETELRLVREELARIRQEETRLRAVFRVLAWAGIALALALGIIAVIGVVDDHAQTAQINRLTEQNKRLIGQGRQAQREICTSSNVYRAREGALWDRDLAALVATGAMTQAEAAAENALVDAFDSPRDCAKLAPLGP